jgi:asparagine synthase (glutamine-hydrolysing)
MGRWWSLAQAVKDGAHHPLPEEEALPALEAQLREAVRIQSLADVPLGAFLSGGVDSATIVALMQAQTSRPVQTFTIGFEEAGFDESPHARAVAQHLGTDHHALFVSAAQTREVIPQLPQMYDEPFADSSQIPTHLVCRAARKHVTVALSGDAGDELFGGYNRYLWGPRLWRRIGALPYALREFAARGLQALPPAWWDSVLGRAGVVRPGEKLHKLGRAMRGAHTLDDLYGNLISEWPRDLALALQTTGKLTPPALPWPERGAETPAAAMMYHDALTYMPDDILCKVDRAAMAVSLETRVPFLDHRVAELAWRLPMHMKIRGNVGKWALRQVLYRHVPQAMIERPKAGFAVPVGQWLRGPLRAWAEALLDEDRLRREAYLDPTPVRAAWRQHLSGRYDWTPRLWSVLMFQAWLEENR